LASGVGASEKTLASCAWPQRRQPERRRQLLAGRDQAATLLEVSKMVMFSSPSR